jgi:uncharacterized membrane protein
LAEVRTVVEIDAPPEEVWKVVGDPRNLPQWDPHITKVEDVPADGLREGSDYETELRFMGVRARVTAHVAELRPAEYSRIRLYGPLLDATVVTRLSPLDGDRTRLEHEVDYRFRGGWLGRLAGRALALTGGPEIALRRGTLAQKRQIEERLAR